ncbi:MAG: flagellar hook protein FlgE [Ectothiorhodospiraceae bacterium]|jgi:flagellar hook protein FlgE
MSFETALTGLNAAASDLDVTGNNIANSGTAGFKYSRAEFADIFASSNLGVSQNAIGAGVRLSKVSQQFTQGQFDFTGNTLDLGVNGTGFFRMSDNGAVSFTRNGAFELDRDGYIVDAGGRRLTGYLATASGSVGGALGELQVNVGNVSPQATTGVDLTANLDAGATPPANAFDATDPDSYNFSTSTTVYDGQGNDHLATMYFRKVTDNQWEVYTDGSDGSGPQGPTTVNFDSNGNFASTGGPTSFNFNYGGAGTSTIAMDYTTLTQYGADFDVKSVDQDGFGAGQFSSLGVESDGRIVARFTNGQSQLLGQIALSRFPSPGNLQQVGDTNWVETFQSGAPVTAAPESSGLGAIQSGALEQSNVNLTEQLVQMITAQRNYQANSQMISTQNSITHEILNLR